MHDSFPVHHRYTGTYSSTMMDLVISLTNAKHDIALKQTQRAMTYTWHTICLRHLLCVCAPINDFCMRKTGKKCLIKQKIVPHMPWKFKLSCSQSRKQQK